MSREIRFRARRIDNGDWVYGRYFRTPLSDENSGATMDKGWFFLCGEKRHCIERDGVAFVIDESTLGQFTGLEDKNGKDIHEGDSVRCDIIEPDSELHGALCFVEWVDDGFALVSSRHEYMQMLSHCVLNKRIEVIGNIY